MTGDGTALPDRVREAAAWVAERADDVTIDRDAIPAYAGAMPERAAVPGLDPEAHYVEGSRHDVAAFVLCVDAMNFGSGWWPTIRKRPGRSGYFTMASALADRFRSAGPWPAEALAELQPGELAAVLGQDPHHELVPLFADALRDLGAHVRDEYGGDYLGVVEEATGSAVALATRLAEWRCFFDVSAYKGREVPFFKRAQLTPADLEAAGVGEFADLDRLTAFADNLVPHVLTLDGILVLSDELDAAIRAEELLVHDSPAEVELRACAVHAVELIAQALDGRLSPAAIDFVLWNRGQEPRAKARPRPRARSTAY